MFLESLVDFTSKYYGKTVTGLVGSSVNFTWSFTGDANRVYWGLKRDGDDGFENNGRLVYLDDRGSVLVTAPLEYDGRVSGSGDVSSGQVIFTLSSIRKSDQRFYGCMLYPNHPFYRRVFDSVYLAVEGEFPLTTH